MGKFTKSITKAIISASKVKKVEKKVVKKEKKDK